MPSLKANDSKNATGGPPIEPLEAGTYPARLLQVLDLGLQEQRPYMGEEKPPAYEINVTYELCDEFLKDEDGNDDEEKPRVVSERFKLYPLNSDRAISTKRYLAIDPEVNHDSDWFALLGMPVNVSIVQNPGKGANAGKVYNNVESTSVMRAKDAERYPEMVNGAKTFLLDEPDMEVFDSLPDFMKKIITSNLEFEGSELQRLLENSPNKGEEPAPNKSEDEDENPY